MSLAFWKKTQKILSGIYFFYFPNILQFFLEKEKKIQFSEKFLQKLRSYLKIMLKTKIIS